MTTVVKIKIKRGRALLLDKQQTYSIFSIKRPQRLFQTWHGEPGRLFELAIYF